MELLRVSLALREPFVAAHGTESERDVILVHVVDGAAEGWGECPTLARPTYTAEYTDAAWSVLCSEIVPSLLEGDPLDVSEHPMAVSAVETALLDLRLRSAGRSLAAEIGAVRTELDTVAVVGVATDPGELVERVAGHIARGVVGIKLKIRPGWDVVPLAELRRCWPEMWLAADANCSYGDDPACVPHAALDGLYLRYVEQPLVPAAPEAAARLAAVMATPLALDESIASPESLTRALDAGCGRVVNIKPTRMGGIGAALEALGLCADRGAGCFVGGMLETGVGRSAALAVAARPECTLPTDLGPSSRYFDDDVTEPIVTSDAGRVVVPSGDGLGVTPDPVRLERFVTRSAVFENA